MKLVSKLVESEANKSAVVKHLAKKKHELNEVRERLEGLIAYSTAKIIRRKI